MEALTFGLKLLAELVPLFLLISTVVYLVVDRWTPDRMRALLGGRSLWAGVPLAAGLGALTPFCSCSTVPVVNGMRTAGIPVAVLVTFLIASPLISPVAVALLGAAFGLQYALLYTASGLVVAAGAGLAVSRWHGAELVPLAVATVSASGASSCSGGRCSAASASSGGCAGTPQMPLALADGIRSSFSRACGDLRKLWLPLTVAVAAGAAIHGYVPADLLSGESLHGGWAIPAAALLGLPVYASVVVLLPLGSTLLAKGVGVGAVTAFLMGASGFSVPEGILLSRILPVDLLLRILVAFAAGVVSIGYLFDWVIP